MLVVVGFRKMSLSRLVVFLVIVMGSPVSGTIAEIFIQHLEDSLIKHLLDSKTIEFYARYVDDILII